MTIPSTATEISYAGDGVTTAFVIPFVFDTSSDLEVIETDATGQPTVVSTGFAITGGSGSTGTLTRSLALPLGTILTILDNPALTQPIDYIDNDSFPAETHEGALDRTVRQVKRLNQRVDRSIRVQDGDLVDGDDLLLPISSTRQGKFLAFDSNGQPTVSSGSGGGDASLRTDLANAGASFGDYLVAAARTADEVAAGVTPANVSPLSPQGIPRRYGSPGALTAANWRNLHRKQGRMLCLQDVVADAGMGDTSGTTDTAAIIAAAAQLGQIGPIYLPQTNLGYYIKPNQITFSGPIQLVGDGRALGLSMLTAVGFATGQKMFTWDTGTTSYILNAGMRGFYCRTTNNFGSVMQLTRCAESEFTDVYCEGLEDFCESNLSYSNTFRHINLRNHRRYGFKFLGASNDILLDRCLMDGVLSGAYGVYVLGGGAFGVRPIHVTRCRFEGYTNAGAHALLLAPATGEILYGFIVRGCYFEGSKGEDILSIPVDAGGVRNLVVDDCTFVGDGTPAEPMVIKQTWGAYVRRNAIGYGAVSFGGVVSGYTTAVVGSQGDNVDLVIEDNKLSGTLVPYAVISGTDINRVQIANNRNNSAVNVDGTTLSPAQITANTDNYAPTGWNAYGKVLRLTTDASRNLTGLQGGYDGREAEIYNVGAQDLVLMDDVTSTAANRFKLGANVTLNANEGIRLRYDATSSRWRSAGRHN